MTTNKTEAPAKPSDLAKAMNINHKTVLDMMKRGDIKHVKIGKQYRIPRSEYQRLTEGL